jgi:Trk K+ transport system NAD-binding subunit
LVLTEEGHGLTVSELQTRGDLRVAAIERGGRTRIPAGGDRLQRHDLIVAAIRNGRVGRKARGLVTSPAKARRA